MKKSWAAAWSPKAPDLRGPRLADLEDALTKEPGVPRSRVQARSFVDKPKRPGGPGQSPRNRAFLAGVSAAKTDQRGTGVDLFATAKKSAR